MHGLRVIKAMGGETWAVDRYRQTSDAAAMAGIATGERTGRLAGLGALVMSAVLATVLIVAGLRLIDGQMSVGALIGILGMTAFLTEPMRTLAEIVGLFAQSHGAAERTARPPCDAAAEAEKDSTAAVSEVVVSGSGVIVAGWPGGGEEFATVCGELSCIVTETAEHSTRLHSALSARAR